MVVHHHHPQPEPRLMPLEAVATKEPATAALEVATPFPLQVWPLDAWLLQLVMSPAPVAALILWVAPVLMLVLMPWPKLQLVLVQQLPLLSLGSPCAPSRPRPLRQV